MKSKKPIKVEKGRKILFVQPAFAHYREELFDILSESHNIHFIFERSKNTYPGQKKPKEICCTFIDRKFNRNYIGFSYYFLKYDFDLVILSGSKSLRTIILFIWSIIFRKKIILWTLEWREPYIKKYSVKKLMGFVKTSIAKLIIRKSHALVVGGTASRNYVLSVRKKENEIFLAFQCSKDIKKLQQYYSEEEYVKDKYIFLFLGRIISWKGLDILIKAFHLLKQKRDDVSLLIVGDGPAKKSCLNLAKSLNVTDVEFIGSINPDRIKECYQKADVFVLPSCELDTYYEAWGLVINEAMSMELPVITTTAVGASFDMIEEGYNGFIVRDNCVGELYQAMSKILQCDLIQMGTNSRKIFKRKNNYKKMANGFFNAIAYVNQQENRKIKKK